MDILLGLVLVAVCLGVLWLVGYKGLLPVPYDKWAMAIAVALGSGGLWLVFRRGSVKETVKEPDPVHLPVTPPTVIEVPSQTEVDRVTVEAREQDKALEESKNEVAPDDRGTDNDRTGSALAERSRL
jgi:hypothetical protein